MKKLFKRFSFAILFSIRLIVVSSVIVLCYGGTSLESENFMASFTIADMQELGIMDPHNPVNENAHIYIKLETEIMDMLVTLGFLMMLFFIRDKSNEVNGFYVQTTGGNLSTNIRFDKVE